VLICDWHYERADKTAVYFGMKGFQVVTCPWRNPVVGRQQVLDMENFRNTATPEMKSNFSGILQTVWSDTGSFLDEFYGLKKDPAEGDNTSANCFRSVFPKAVRQK
jgi:hypothetical protein